jgi:hypothetical protein
VTPEPVRQPEQASGVLVTAGARKLCRAVGATAWAVLCDIALDAEADAHGNLVAATNVRRIAGDLGISKDTAARALARLTNAGLIGPERPSPERSIHGLDLRGAPGRRLGDHVAWRSFLFRGSVSGCCGHGRRPGQGGYRPPGESPFAPACVVPTPADAGGASVAVPAGRSAGGRPVMGVAPLVEPVSVVQESRTPVVVDHDDRTVPGHHGHAVTAQHLAQPAPAHIRTQQLTTTPAASLHHAHDALTTTVHNASDDHPKKPSRHWHPAVPFLGAAVTGAAEAAKAAPC